MIRYQNSRIKLEIETNPSFRIVAFQSAVTGKNILSAESGMMYGDRAALPSMKLLEEKKISPRQWLLTYQRGPLTIKRYVEVYENAPAIRWYDEYMTETDLAGLYYSDLAEFHFAEDQKFTCMNFFSCSDQSNHRLIEKPAAAGKNQGAFFFSEQCWIYKEGPMPDCQPVKGEYDFLWKPEDKILNLLGLGFENIHSGEIRRANGVVIGLAENYGMQRYRLERYKGFPKTASTEVLSNSWPDLTLGVNEEAIMKEVKSAAEAGVNVIFIDDGWFKIFMGDIDEEKFPNKFKVLSSEAKKNGVELGLWMNPLGLDIRHPKMELWDGAECHDAMLERNPWNWAARNKDFCYAEVYGTCEDKRSYAGIELMNPEVFAFRKQQIIDMYKNYGIRHFKFDLYRLNSFNTLWGDAQLHYECYRKLLSELQKEIPELIISMDVTRRERPNFDFALDFGRLFLENRGRKNHDHRYYYPYMALGNFWYTLKYVPGIQMEIEMMPQAMDFDLDYILGTTIFGAPLYWGCIVSTPPERCNAMKLFYEKMAPLRKKFAGYINLPVGNMPIKGSWSGILSIAPDESEFYLAVYRNGAVLPEYKFALPFSGKLELIHGGAEFEADGTIRMNKEYSFALLHGTKA